MDPMESHDSVLGGFVNRRFRVRFPGAAPLFFGLFFATFALVDRVSGAANRRGGRQTLPISGLTRDEARALLEAHRD